MIGNSEGKGLKETKGGREVMNGGRRKGERKGKVNENEERKKIE